MSVAKDPAHYIVDEDGNRTAVVVSVEFWDALMNLLEDLEDSQLVVDWLTRVAQGPEAAGALRWEAVRDDL